MSTQTTQATEQARGDATSDQHLHETDGDLSVSVDRLLAAHRRFAEALLTPPAGR